MDLYRLLTLASLLWQSVVSFHSKSHSKTNVLLSVRTKSTCFRSTDASKTPFIEEREEDFEQIRDLDLILSERAKRFYGNDVNGPPKLKEQCVLLSIDSKSQHSKSMPNSVTEDDYFSFEESLNELSELVGTAGLQVVGTCFQKLNAPNSNSYVNSGKAYDLMAIVNSTGAQTIVVDDDLSAKQQRNLESLCASYGGADVKILDRTAIILEIFAQHAQSREGQLQVELAMLEYRLTRGPSNKGNPDRDSGAGFRGPGETKIETDRRFIREKIIRIKREIDILGTQREQHRKNRNRLGLPLVALVGYTNAGKSTVMNRLSRAGVLAENMLFATLDPTIRKIHLPKVIKTKTVDRNDDDDDDNDDDDKLKSNVVSEYDNILNDDDDDDDDVAIAIVRQKAIINDDITSQNNDNNNDDDDDDENQPIKKQEELILNSLSQKMNTNDNTNSGDGYEDPVISAVMANERLNQVKRKLAQMTDGYEVSAKGQEIFLTDTVGFISKLPTDLIAAFRATLEELREADVLVHVIDRSSPVWRKQRSTVLKELEAIGCMDTPIVELWNKLDAFDHDPKRQLELYEETLAVETEAAFTTASADNQSSDRGGVDRMIGDISQNNDDENSDNNNNNNNADGERDDEYDYIPTITADTTDMIDNLSLATTTTTAATATVISPKQAQQQERNDILKNRKKRIFVTGTKTSNTNSKSRRSKAIVDGNSDNFFWSDEDANHDNSHNDNNSNNNDDDYGGGYIKESINNNNSNNNDTTQNKPRIIRVVAASAKTGLGFNKFLSTVQDTLNTLLQSITVFVPYDKDEGVVDQIFKQGVTENVEYRSTGTYISCRVSESLQQKIIKFKVSEEHEENNQ